MPTDRSLARKCELLTPVLHAGALSAGGASSTWAPTRRSSRSWPCRTGRSDATAVDMDLAHVEHVRNAAAALGYQRLTAVHGNVADWHEPADIVVALALVHWLYNCTAAFGSLSAVVERLASLAGDALIVEWVDPADPAIDFFGHLSWNAGPTSGPYNRTVFERSWGGISRASVRSATCRPPAGCFSRRSAVTTSTCAARCRCGIQPGRSSPAAC